MRCVKDVLHQLWRDEIGVILSAEAALLGTVAVIGTTVGLSAVSHSVNEELTEVASAFRSLDQSYHFEGRHGCGAWTAGSSYRQPCVEESLEELQTFVGELEEQHQHDSDHRRHHEEGANDDGDDDRPHGRRDSDDDEGDDDADDDRDEADDEDDDEQEGEEDRPGRRRQQEEDDSDDEPRPRGRREDDRRDDDELTLEIDAPGAEFSEPIRIRPATGE